MTPLTVTGLPLPTFLSLNVAPYTDESIVTVRARRHRPASAA